MTTAIWGNSLYLAVDGPSWAEAESQSIAIGGHLVAINSSDENEFLIDSFRDQNLSYYGGAADQDIYWIGLTKSSGIWQWSDGSTLAFENWGPKEPFEDNGSSDRAEIILESYQFSADPLFWTNTAGNWNNNSDALSPQGRYGIAELSLNLTTDLPAELNEGEDFLLNVDLTAGSTGTTYTAGQSIWYQIDGVQESDFTNDVSLSGWGVIAESGNIILEGATEEGIALNLAADSEDEGETLRISFYSEDPSATTFALSQIQIGETVSAEVIDAVDPITGTLGLPGKVNLKSQGKTPFVLYGNEELVFDPEVQDSLINPESLGFGLVPGDTLFTAATKKNGTIHASYEDVDGDTYLDFVVKVDTPTIASSELAAGEQDVFAFATTNGGQDLLFTAPSAVFF